MDPLSSACGWEKVAHFFLRGLADGLKTLHTSLATRVVSSLAWGKTFSDETSIEKIFDSGLSQAYRLSSDSESCL